jgi:hypothetical protein
MSCTNWKYLSLASAAFPRLNIHKVDIELLNSYTSFIMAAKFNQCSMVVIVNLKGPVYILVRYGLIWCSFSNTLKVVPALVNEIIGVVH